MIDKDRIYLLKLHGSALLAVDNATINVLRVPGGWIYTVQYDELYEKPESKNDIPKKIVHVSSTFVPLSGEFNI